MKKITMKELREKARYIQIALPYDKRDEYNLITFDDGVMKELEQNATANATVNATVKLSKTQKKILHIIRDDKYATYDEIAKILDVERTTVWRNLDSLKKNGAIIRVGGDKNGYWEVLIKDGNV